MQVDMNRDDIVAGGAGAAAGAGIGASIGGLGSAGLAIGGTAYAIPAVVVVAAPAAGVGVAAFVGYKGVKFGWKKWKS